VTPTIARNLELIRQFWDAVYAHQFAQVATYFADDAEYDDVPIPAAKVFGPAAIARKLEIGFGRVPRHVHHVHRVVADETTVVTEHTEDWCFADDHIVSLPFVSVQVIDNGKIKLWRDYSNIDTLLSAAPQWWLEHVTTAWSQAAEVGDGRTT
jgi:limonene-1,2-epoxide hydrolase